jgi:hypothetical protein
MLLKISVLLFFYQCQMVKAFGAVTASELLIGGSMGAELLTG